MVDNFLDEVKSKSNDELKSIVININLYRGALIAAARQELTNRGIELSVEEMQKIDEIKSQRKKDAVNSKISIKRWDWIYPNWKRNIVYDIDAPQLYSRKVINAFSILFSVLFGGILLAINLKTVNNKKAILPVLIYSIVFTGLMIYILNLIPGNKSPLTIAFNAIGGTVLYNSFWSKYIGKDFQYRTKPFWIPLIIAIFILGFYIWTLFANYQK